MAGLKRFSQALRRELAGGPLRITHSAPCAIGTAYNLNRVNALNLEVNIRSDIPASVTDAIVHPIQRSTAELQIGFPEQLFA